MRVLVSLRRADAASYVEPRDALALDWAGLLRGLGVLPLLVPNDPDLVPDYLSQGGAQALLLTGGDDLGPLAGEAGGPAPHRRDRAEQLLLQGAESRGLPVLAVCRGLQMVNVWRGGGLSRSLSSPHVGEHPARLLRDWGGWRAGCTFSVNSYHNHGVTVAQLAPGLEPVLLAPDGTVEAFTAVDAPLWAMQWHPERPDPSSALSRSFLDPWLRAAQGARQMAT